MAELVVGRAADVPPGQRLLVTVEGREIGIFNLEGSYHAYLNRCPDQGGPVCRGGIFDSFASEVASDGGVREFIASRQDVLACPWHGWEYDLRTGACLWNRSYHLRRYRVEVDGEGNLVLTV